MNGIINGILYPFVLAVAKGFIDLSKVFPSYLFYVHSSLFINSLKKEMKKRGASLDNLAKHLMRHEVSLSFLTDAIEVGLDVNFIHKGKTFLETQMAFPLPFMQGITIIIKYKCNK